MLKQRNNHGAAPCPDEDSRAVEAVFMCLGNVLAEVARDMVQRKANISQNIARDRDDISASQEK